MSMVSPTGFNWETLCHLGVPRCSINVAKGTGRTHMGQLLNDFLLDFDQKSMILGRRGALAPVLGRVSKSVSEKNKFVAKGGFHLGTNFRYIRTFSRVCFPVIF